MKILVCCKAVPKGATNIKLEEKTGKIVYENDSLDMNESDACALEEALELKKQSGAEITIITMGGLTFQEMLRVALAKGADKAIRIDADFTDPATTARLMAKAIKEMEYDIIMTGIESYDNMSAQTAVSTAEILGIPYAFAVTKVEIDKEQRTVQVIKEMGQGVSESLEIRLPALLCIESGTRLVSYPLLMKLMQARRMTIKSIGLDDFGVSNDEVPGNEPRLLEVFEPLRSSNCQMIKGNPEEIARELTGKIDDVLR